MPYSNRSTSLSRFKHGRPDPWAASSCEQIGHSWRSGEHRYSPKTRSWFVVRQCVACGERVVQGVAEPIPEHPASRIAQFLRLTGRKGAARRLIGLFNDGQPDPRWRRSRTSDVDDGKAVAGRTPFGLAPAARLVGVRALSDEGMAAWRAWRPKRHATTSGPDGTIDWVLMPSAKDLASCTGTKLHADIAIVAAGAWTRITSVPRAQQRLDALSAFAVDLLQPLNPPPPPPPKVERTKEGGGKRKGARKKVGKPTPGIPVAPKARKERSVRNHTGNTKHDRVMRGGLKGGHDSAAKRSQREEWVSKLMQHQPTLSTSEIVARATFALRVCASTVYDYIARIRAEGHEAIERKAQAAIRSGLATTIAFRTAASSLRDALDRISQSLRSGRSIAAWKAAVEEAAPVAADLLKGICRPLPRAAGPP